MAVVEEGSGSRAECIQFTGGENMVVFLDPHGDDVALFAAFSLMTPQDGYVLPVVVFDS